MTHLYMAYGGWDRWAATGWDWEENPINFLVALPYLKTYEAHAEKHGYQPRRLMLDSGAFSAWRSGKAIDIDELITATKESRWNESVGLDVIGSWEGSRDNLDYMREQGSAAMPVFHIGDPWDRLTYYCENWAKVGLSCRFGEPENASRTFYDQCFARAWPHPFHSFGWMSNVLYDYPFHSADASTWMQAPLAWGNSRTFGAVRGLSTKHALKMVRKDLIHYGVMEQRLKHRWKKELDTWNTL